MSMTGNENQNTPAEPLPIDEESDATTIAPDAKSGPARIPDTETTTEPTIKNR